MLCFTSKLRACFYFLLLISSCYGPLTVKGAFGGPDLYGYFYTDFIPFSWVDITTTGTPITGLMDDNAVSVSLTLGPVRYYGNDFTSLRIGSNGWIGLNPIANIAHCFPDIPSAGGSGDNYIAPIMSDLCFNCGSPGVAAYILDTPDSVILSFHNVPFWHSVAPGYTGSVTWQVIISRIDESITVNYLDVNTGAFGFTPGCDHDLIVGIESPGGITGLKYLDEIAPLSGSAVRFGPALSSSLSNGVQGTVYSDDNNNGIKDAGEAPIAGILIGSTSPSFFTATDTSGQFSCHADTGSFTVSPWLPPTWTYTAIVPPSRSYFFDSLGYDTLGNDFGIQGLSPLTDIRTVISYSGPLVPGFSRIVYVDIANLGPFPASDTLVAVIDTNLIISGYSPAPFSVSGNTITWLYPTLVSGSWLHYEVYVTVDLAAVPGTPVTSHSNAGPFAPLDLNPANNPDTISAILVAAYDPNDKSVSPSGDVDTAFVNAHKPLQYLIRFQNIGTAPAEDVVIRDTLDNDLDMTTFRLLSASDPVSVIIYDRVLKFTFEDIFLPDSTSDEPGSHGYVVYEMEIEDGSAAGTVIENTAAIYFDYNVPIITNTTHTEVADILTAMDSPGGQPAFQVYPVPFHEEINIRMVSAEESGTVGIYDLQGRRVHQCELIRGLASADVSSLTDGVYILEVHTAQNVYRTKVIKAGR